MYKVRQNNNPVADAAGTWWFGWLLPAQAEVALAELEAGPARGDSLIYRGRWKRPLFRPAGPTDVPRTAAHSAAVDNS